MSLTTTESAGRSRVPQTYQDYEGDREFATTLARGLELLRCFTPEDRLLGNRELTQRMALPRSTVSRLTYTLVAMGYLAQDADSGKYRLGAAVLSLGFPLLDTFSVRQRARSAMLALAQRLRGTVAIVIRDRLDMVCIEVARSGTLAVDAMDIGRTYSMCGSAVGRAYLTACTPADRQRLLNQIQVKAPAEWERHQARLQVNLAQYANWGCCVSVGEIYADVQAVAVPLRRQEHGEQAALNISFQRRAPNERWLIEEVGPQLSALARQLM
ncbi:IclR family transcriptional regulator [Hydrogenophaga sp.]|uniref:IclR family transcriptional regulator n=1 Tax=Hydrogenophaga sp. TaxID=1904254 RepID=UPI0027172FF5|nr:IclR family transcriptional regulator [Hydrogenophaga sp.]MDO9438541.1 IclR family transcriptional regulator [Hydrogenophaga sp.]